MLNGKPFTRTYLTHAQLLVGGTRRLTMGPKPNLTCNGPKTSQVIPSTLMM